jgi:DNA-binding LacI/PurR family transcriptional regulator
LQKAEKGIQLLLADIRGQQLTKRTIQITTTFIEGQSVKKIK